MKDTPTFKVSMEDENVIRAIAKRAKEVHNCNALGVSMDVTACHANGCPLDLDKLLAFSPFDFCHDVMGIQDHLDRKTGKMMNYFLPRSAAPQP